MKTETATKPARKTLIHNENWFLLRMWLSGRASPCQGEGREFESRHPLAGNCR